MAQFSLTGIDQFTFDYDMSFLDENIFENCSHKHELHDRTAEFEGLRSSPQIHMPCIFIRFGTQNNPDAFEERCITLDKPCKVGRSVCGLGIKPSTENLIFDCKVISHNHALIWHEKGKFFIRDTKSTNGTFLNGKRLSAMSQESLPFELLLGDKIQFGVDIIGKTTKLQNCCLSVEIKLIMRG